MQQRDSRAEGDGWFSNFKMVVHNVNKRKSNDSGLDDTYDTPAKKVRIPTPASPDLGCFVGSILNTSTPLSLELKNKQPVQTVNSSSGEKDSISSSGILPALERSTDRSEKVAVNLGPAFDFDVEEILCLSPIKKCSCPTGAGNHLSCPVANSSAFRKKPVEDQCPAIRDNVGGDGRECLSKTIKGDNVGGDGRECLSKTIKGVVPEENAAGEKVYFSRRYLEAMKRKGKDHTQLSASPLLAHTTSRPRVHERVDESEVFPGEPVVCEQKISFTLNDISATVSRAPLTSIQGTVEALEGDVDDAWNIGNPLSESSTLSADSEKNVVGIQEVKDCQEKPKEVDNMVTVETSFEESSFEKTLLKVQVKSKVVVFPSQKTESETSQAVSETTSPDHQSLPNHSQRSVVLDSGTDFHCAWQKYVRSVKRHIDESKGSIPEQQNQESSAASDHQRQPTNELDSQSATAMASADGGAGVGVGETQEGDVTAETSFTDTSYEDTPIKVQVKSKLVVIPSRRTVTEQSLSSFFGVDYHRKKQQYVWAVRRHMEENLGGAMAELENVMYDVANQGWHSASSHQWQHPSDLTVRNYRRQFQHKTQVRSLREWKDHNVFGGARFFTVPQKFQRSPVFL